MFAREKCISPHPQLFQNENVCEADQHNEQPVIARFGRKKVGGACGDLVPLRTLTKATARKLRWEISAFVLPDPQESPIRSPSAAA